MDGVVVLCVQGRPYACGLEQGRGAQTRTGFWVRAVRHLARQRRTSSAEVERSAAILLGMQLDSSPLVLVAEVSCLLALRPRPIDRDVCGCCVRREGEGEVRSASRSAQCAVGRWSACTMPRLEALVKNTPFVGILFASSYFSWQAGRWPACCSAERVKTVVRPVVRVPSLCAVQLSRLI